MKAILIIIGIIFMGWIFIEAAKSTAARREWLAAHCVVVGKIAGSYGTGTGIGMDGNVTFVNYHTSGKTVYQCDDGITYQE